MKVNRLKLTNVRAIAAAEFYFEPDFNLIVGVNGVGKTTVLDALSACLAAFIFNDSGLPPRRTLLAQSTDVQVGAAALDVECEIENRGARFTYSHHKRRDAPHGPNSLKQLSPASTGLEDTRDAALAVLFATNRAVPSKRVPGAKMAAGGKVAAVTGAFARRALRLAEFSTWMRAQRELSEELPRAASALGAVEDTVKRLLPGYQRLRVDGGDGSDLLIDRGDKTLSVRQLSHGERGILALVLDVTRRLSQANPHMGDPAAEAQAVVLIDELELHLHPQWQRRIVRNLRSAFPRCQFIATTHSPQVIGEVEPDRIHVIADGEVYSPTHSFGVDSSRVLEELMDAPPRAESVHCLLSEISQKIGKSRFDEARPLVTQLVGILGENDPEVTRVRALLDFMEGEE